MNCFICTRYAIKHQYHQYLALGLASLARGVFLLNNVKASIIDIEIKFR